VLVPLLAPFRTRVLPLACLLLLASPSFGLPIGAVAPPSAPPGLPLPAADPAVCPPGAPLRRFDVTALPVPTSYNHWGDWDPRGELLALDGERAPLLQQTADRLAAAGLSALADDVARLRDALGSFSAVQAAADLEAHAAELAAHASTDPRFARDAAAGPAAPDVPRYDTVELQRPLVLRARLGECVEIHLLNLLASPIGLSAAGLLEAPGEGTAVGGQAPRMAFPGQVRTARLFLPDVPGVEGAHLLTSPTEARYHTQHGLFGALVAEPARARWVAPDGGSLPSGPEAMLVDPAGSDFREFVVIYHDELELLDNVGRPLPITNPADGEYGPGTKGINLRSEPFLRRLDYVDALHAQGVLPFGRDKSLAYSSYSNGDPATFLPRAYLGDPTKFRLANVGPGQPHVHHLHGGGVRWRSSPEADGTQFDMGLMKMPGMTASPSERTDVQNLVPGESFTAEVEGGAGGVQQSVGDFLYHCHIVEHYLSGMWGIWRVFGTRQEGLAELPDRHHQVPRAVDSLHLLGATLPGGTVLNRSNLAAWVEAQLPPRGVPDGYDASVWDWSVEEHRKGPLYLGEPETTLAWPNYRSSTPGERPPLLFDPQTGRLAYPFLSPHLGARPPFAPSHDPAPYLGRSTDSDHPDGLCPPGARPVTYNIVAVPTTVHYNDRQADPLGQVFVLAGDKDAVLSGAKPATSLLVRANQGDCVDLTLTSELRDGELPSKVDLHMHLMQFDVQASDGVVAGFNFEQGVRPAQLTGTALASAAAAGNATLAVADATALRPGTTVGVGLGTENLEVRRVLSVVAGVATLDAPLALNHSAGERVGTEFARSRFYADVELGTVYWHDHVDGLNSWRHGLFGTLVVEPAGSQWCDPKRPASAAAHCGHHVLHEGHVADIVSADPAKASDGRYTFRELALQFQDRGCVPAFGIDCLSKTFPTGPIPGRDPASFNLRAEPLGDRDPVATLSSAGTRPATGGPQGDPATDLLLAYPGDATVVRLVYAGQSQTRAQATFTVTGHRFPQEQHLPGSPTVDRVTFGISSQHNLRLECGAGGCGHLPGDYLYQIAQPETFYRGAWGILRVLEPGGTLTPLPSNPSPQAGPPPTGPTRHYDVVALEVPLAYSTEPVSDPPGAYTVPTRLYALASDAAAILAGTLRPEPLVLRMLPGEVLEVNLTNRLPVPAGFTASLLQPVRAADLGIPVGNAAATVVAPGANATYRYFAGRELGASYVTSYGQQVTPPGSPLAGLLADPALQGLYGLVVVEPPGSAWTPATGAQSLLRLADGGASVEQALLYASDDPKFEGSVMPYLHAVHGIAATNYRTAPVSGRVGVAGAPQSATVHPCDFDGGPVLGQDCGFNLAHAEARNPLLPWAFAGNPPETPRIVVRSGQGLVVRAAGAAGDQVQVHALPGHAWAAAPGMPGCRALAAACASNVASTDTLGTGQVHDDWIPAAQLTMPGLSLWGDGRAPFAEAGQWGVLEVQPP
jgi:FtsP/CotA-like multicopper oxidase with cupredoxin domain